MVQAVSRRHFTAEPRVRFQDSAFQIRGEQSGTGAGFSPSASVFAYQNHSTFAPYSFIHLPPTLYNVFLPVLQYSPVSIIPPSLHSLSSIYHPRCIMFFSQCFSILLSVSFPKCPTLIFLLQQSTFAYIKHMYYRSRRQDRLNINTICQSEQLLFSHVYLRSFSVVVTRSWRKK